MKSDITGELSRRVKILESQVHTYREMLAFTGRTLELEANSG